MSRPETGGRGFASGTRREFLRGVACLGGLAALGGWRFPAGGGEVLRVGLVLPAEGADAAADAVRRGASMGADEANHTFQLFDRSLVLVPAAAAGAAETTAVLARLAGQDHVIAVVGGGDEASCEALADGAERRGILFFDTGCTSDTLRRARCLSHTFHLQASTAMYLDALAQGLGGSGGDRDAGAGGAAGETGRADTSAARSGAGGAAGAASAGAGGRRSAGRWFFVVPDSAAGRALHEEAAAAFGRQGAADTGAARVADGTQDFAPVLQQATRAGADGIFLGLTGPEQLRFMEQYHAAAPRAQLAGPFLDILRLWAEERPVAAGSWPVLWDPNRKPFGASSLSARYADAFHRPMESHGWAGWLAVKILGEAVLRARTSAPAELAAFLAGDAAEFDGHKGVPLSFRAGDHQLRQPLYLLRAAAQPQGADELFDVVAELPASERSATVSARERLDRLGDAARSGPCPVGSE